MAGINIPKPSKYPKAPPRATNCPNCGAPIEGVKCPYCKTLLLDFADIEMYQPSFVRIKVGGNIVMLLFHFVLIIGYLRLLLLVEIG